MSHSAQANRLLVNFSKGKWYPAGQARLNDSLHAVGFQDNFWLLNDERLIGCPTHQESPYAFKPAIFNKALEAGFRTVLWCDASLFAIKPLGPIFDHIEKYGHAFFYNGWVGEWSSDAALESFCVEREVAMRIHEMMGCCIGLDLTKSKPLEFLRIWREKSLDGKTFPGSWHNVNGEVSKDPRVKGHRHDQTAASLIAYQLGMEKWVSHEIEHPGGQGLLQYYTNPAHTAYNYGYDDNDMSHIRSGVCLLNQGM